VTPREAGAGRFASYRSSRHPAPVLGRPPAATVGYAIVRSGVLDGAGARAFSRSLQRAGPAPRSGRASMHRRQILSSVAAVSAGLVATGAFAQSTAKKTDPDMMGEAETRHAAMTMKVGALSLATSRIAEKKDTGPMVAQFATFEVAEQETIADVLKSMKKSEGAAKGAISKPSESEVMEMLDAEGKRMVETLQGLSGSEFSKMYVTAQTEGHQKLLDIQEDYLKAGENREHLNVAKLARGQIKEHLKLLADIKTDLG
jgi:putative membrane protein